VGAVLVGDRDLVMRRDDPATALTTDDRHVVHPRRHRRALADHHEVVDDILES
jgi:hypothetical protein